MISQDWFELRKTANNTISRLAEDESVMRNDEQVCWHLGTRFSEGGHSDLFRYPGNNNVLIRLIFQDPAHHYVTEIENNRRVTRAVMENINPHFALSYFITPCSDVYHQVIERLDGDIGSMRTFSPDYLRDTYFLPQMLMGLVTLLRNNIRINDVKRENILYHRLDQPVALVYIIDDETYTIITNTIYLFTDFGVSSPYYNRSPHLEDRIKNLTDLHGILKINRGDVTIRIFDPTIIEELAVRDAICGLELTGDINAIIAQIGRSSQDLLRCVKRLLRNMKSEEERRTPSISEKSDYDIGESIPPNIPVVIFNPDTII